MTAAPLLPTLDGVRVVDLTRFIAGPYATLLLADLGAEIWKVESPEGDPTRAMPAQVGGEGMYFVAVNRGKRSIVLDLKQEADKAVFRDMIRVADVVIDNFRHGVMESLGLGYDGLRTLNPGLVSCSITGFGAGSPYEERPAFDIITQALSGAMSLIGEPGGTPFRPGVPAGDIQAGLTADVAILGGLLARSRDGRGRHYEVSLMDTQLSSLVGIAANCLATGKVPGPVGNTNPVTAPYGAFKARDRYVVIAAVGERAWAGLARVLGDPEWMQAPAFATNRDRVANQADCVRRLEAELARDEAAVWSDRLAAAGVPAAVVNSVEDAVNDPHTHARGMLETLPQPQAGPVRVVATPIKGDVGMSGPRAAPLLDADREAILAAIRAGRKET